LQVNHDEAISGKERWGDLGPVAANDALDLEPREPEKCRGRSCAGMYLAAVQYAAMSTTSQQLGLEQNK
jgi:hypothetical protein